VQGVELGFGEGRVRLDRLGRDTSEGVVVQQCARGGAEPLLQLFRPRLGNGAEGRFGLRAWHFLIIPVESIQEPWRQIELCL
jgi:hypothetical protein